MRPATTAAGAVNQKSPGHSGAISSPALDVRLMTALQVLQVPSHGTIKAARRCPCLDFFCVRRLTRTVRLGLDTKKKERKRTSKREGWEDSQHVATTQGF